MTVSVFSALRSEMIERIGSALRSEMIECLGDDRPSMSWASLDRLASELASLAARAGADWASFLNDQELEGDNTVWQGPWQALQEEVDRLVDRDWLSDDSSDLIDRWVVYHFDRALSAVRFQDGFRLAPGYRPTFTDPALFAA